MTEPIMLNCPNHGQCEWQGDVFCKHCSAIYLCSDVTEDENGKTIHVYPDAPAKGLCTCEKRLFGGSDFTARPMCHECALTVMNRKAAKEGKVLWVPDPDEHDGTGEMADPDGNHTYMLGVFRHSPGWHWEVSFPNGHCSGDESTKEEARAFAEKIYRAIVAK